MNPPIRLAAAGALFLSFAGATQDVSGPFQARVYGAFRQMMHRSDFSPKVGLGPALSSNPTEGVGALAGLRGEVSIIEGRLVVSCGSRARCEQPLDETATLLATARVSRWREPVELASDLRGKDLEAFLLSRARDTGLDLATPFALRLRGSLIDARMHVVSAPNPVLAGHGSGQPLAQQDDIVADRIDGEVVGFYAPESLRGVATHPGEAFHFHWVDSARTRTAHLDAFGAAAGSLLILPSPAQP